MAVEWKVYVHVNGYADLNGLANIVIFHAASEAAADTEITNIKTATDFHTIDGKEIEVRHIALIQKILVETG